MSRTVTAFAFLILLPFTGCGSRPAPPPPPVPTIPEATALKTLAPGMHKLAIDVPGVGPCNYTLFIPPTYDGKSAVPLIVALHYGGSVSPHYGKGMIDALIEPALGSLGAIVLAPDAMKGKDWTSTDNEIAVVWLTRSVMKSYLIDAKKVLLTGFSMGGQGTWFIGGRHQDLYTAAVVVAGSPTGGEMAWKIPIYVIHSTDDKVLPVGPTQGYVGAIKGAGADVELKVVSGYDHYKTAEFATPMKAAAEWLKKKWEAK